MQEKAPSELLRGTVMDQTANAPDKQVTALAVPLFTHTHKHAVQKRVMWIHILTAFWIMYVMYTLSTSFLL